MFRDKLELKDIEKMDAECRELLGRILTIQSDCEIGGPHLYVKRHGSDGHAGGKPEDDAGWWDIPCLFGDFSPD